jgi:hypothetical protein
MSACQPPAISAFGQKREQQNCCAVRFGLGGSSKRLAASHMATKLQVVMSCSCCRPVGLLHTGEVARGGNFARLWGPCSSAPMQRFPHRLAASTVLTLAGWLALLGAPGLDCRVMSCNDMEACRKLLVGLLVWGVMVWLEKILR